MLDIPKVPFIFVRHGRTDWSYQEITNGPANYPLNETGRIEAQAVEKNLSSMGGPFKFFSSPLNRAKQTAEIINAHWNQHITIVDDLQERYYGDLNLLFALPKPLPKSLDSESEAAFAERVARVAHAVLTQSVSGTKIVIVSHGLVFRKLTLLLNGKEESIGYGQAFLFTPSESSNAWQQERI